MKITKPLLEQIIKEETQKLLTEKSWYDYLEIGDLASDPVHKKVARAVTPKKKTASERENIEGFRKAAFVSDVRQQIPTGDTQIINPESNVDIGWFGDRSVPPIIYDFFGPENAPRGEHGQKIARGRGQEGDWRPWMRDPEGVPFAGGDVKTDVGTARPEDLKHPAGGATVMQGPAVQDPETGEYVHQGVVGGTQPGLSKDMIFNPEWLPIDIATGDARLALKAALWPFITGKNIIQKGAGAIGRKAGSEAVEQTAKAAGSEAVEQTAKAAGAGAAGMKAGTKELQALDAAHKTSVVKVGTPRSNLTGTKFKELGFEESSHRDLLRTLREHHDVHADTAFAEMIEKMGGPEKFKKFIDTRFPELKDSQKYMSSLQKQRNPKTKMLYTENEARSRVRSGFNSLHASMGTSTGYNRNVLANTPAGTINVASRKDTEKLLGELASGENSQYDELLKLVGDAGASKSAKARGITKDFGTHKLKINQSFGPGSKSGVLKSPYILKTEEAIAKRLGKPGLGAGETRKINVIRTDASTGYSTEIHIYWNDAWTRQGLTPEMVDDILKESGQIDGIWKFKKHARKDISKADRGALDKLYDAGLQLQERLLRLGIISKGLSYLKLKKIIKEEYDLQERGRKLT